MVTYMKRFEKKEELDVKKVNEVVSLSKKILKIFYTVLVLGIIVLALYLLEKTNILREICSVVKVISPLFIGFIVAWLLNPFVELLEKKKIKRLLGSIIVFIIFLLVIYLIVRLIVPMLYKQINEFIDMLPSLFRGIKVFVNDLFKRVGNNGIDLSSYQKSIYSSIEKISLDLTTDLPTKVISVITSLISGVGTFLLGLIIGFYLLVDFKATNYIYELIPKKYHIGLKNVLMKLDGVFRDFVSGTLVISLIITIISSIAFKIVGLPSPLLFGFICGLTNIIRYIGPWIGGTLAAIVGFTVSPVVGILVIVIAFIVQQIDGLILQPVIMSKAVKLHPVTIMIGLLVFGHLFGIWGMIFATPVISSIKVIVNYFNEKYEIIDNIKKNNEIRE